MEFSFFERNYFSPEHKSKIFSMVKVKDILREIEHYAPLPLQEGFDNAGVQVGDVNQHATGVLLCLDVTEEVLDEAIEMGCNLIISHHPFGL